MSWAQFWLDEDNVLHAEPPIDSEDGLDGILHLIDIEALKASQQLVDNLDKLFESIVIINSEIPLERHEAQWTVDWMRERSRMAKGLIAAWKKVNETSNT